MNTRASNKNAHPGLPDVTGPRRSHQQVTADTEAASIQKATKQKLKVTKIQAIAEKENAMATADAAAKSNTSWPLAAAKSKVIRKMGVQADQRRKAQPGGELLTLRSKPFAVNSASQITALSLPLHLDMKEEVLTRISGRQMQWTPEQLSRLNVLVLTLAYILNLQAAIEGVYLCPDSPQIEVVNLFLISSIGGWSYLKE
jgi:hypothetical protein